MRAFEQLDGFLGRLEAAADLNAVKRLLDGELRQRGFGRFAYVQLKPPRVSVDRIYLGTYPQEWTDRYRALDLHLHDPLHAWALGVLRPFLWDDVRRVQPSAAADRLVFGPGGEVGLKTGAGIPIHGPHGASAALQIAVDGDDASFRAAFAEQDHALQLIAIRVHEQVLKLSGDAPVAGFQLTPRQIEVLHWVAQGKTNWEIGRLLNIAEDTVRQHIQNILSVLGAPNRTQATVIAVTHSIVFL